MNVTSTVPAFASAVRGMGRAEAAISHEAESVATDPERIGPESAVNLIKTEAAFKANAAVARTADEMTGRLLDIEA